MAMDSGVKVVLTASATEMSDYHDNPFVAFVAGFAKGPVPLWLWRKIIYPPVGRTDGGRAKYSPYGLRKIEALLLENGFSESDVAVVHPEDLDEFIGSATKVVGISSMDPMGMGYVSQTYCGLVGGGESLNAIEFRKLVEHPSIRRFRPKIVVGGFGSWQLERKKVAARYGIDCVLIGRQKKEILRVFNKAISGDPLPPIVFDNKLPAADDANMPLIRHAAIHGAVEISKGCGRNCQFCTPTMQRKIDVPLDRIMKEVAITTLEGSANITLVTEDLFLYGAKDTRFTPNRKAVLKLISQVADHPGVAAIQPSHMSLAPVVYDPRLVRDVAEVLVEHHWYSHGKKAIVTSETGIETGSVRLMRKYMAGKMLPYTPEQWPEVVSQAFGILNDTDWYPLATLIVGLPDEREEDVAETLELLDTLKGHNAFYVPLVFVPLDNCSLMHQKGAEIDSLSQLRWELLTRCWEYNIRVWRDTFFEYRIRNPIILKAIKRIVVPFTTKVAGLYYDRKHDHHRKPALQRIACA